MAVQIKDLCPIFQSSLSLGKVLPGNLYDEKAKLLIPKGTRLVQANLDCLNSAELHVGEDWPREGDSSHNANAHEILSQLAQAYKQPAKKSVNQRQHTRHQWKVVLTVELHETNGGNTSRQELEVTTQDIAVGGFSFIYKRYINPGSLSYARFETLPNKPCLKAEVKNCVNLGGFQHRIGMQFLKVETPVSN